MIPILFFLLPLFLFLGIALQSASFYVILLVVPIGILVQKRWFLPRFVRNIGICLLVLHVVFPLLSLWKFVFPNDSIENFHYAMVWEWPGILQSNFPSSLFFTGVFLLISYALLKKNTTNPIDMVQKNSSGIFDSSDGQVLLQQKSLVVPWFLLGVSVFFLLYLAVLFLQYRTGIDLRSLGRGSLGFLATQDKFSNGYYRVYGFYGHPLTVASVLLCYFVFLWSLFWSWVVSEKETQRRISVLSLPGRISIFSAPGRSVEARGATCTPEQSVYTSDKQRRISVFSLPGRSAEARGATCTPEQSVYTSDKQRRISVLALSLVLVVPALSCFVGILLTGGRTAFLVAMVFFAFLPFYFGYKKHKKIAVFTVVLSLCLLVFLSQQAGMMNRIQRVFASWGHANYLDPGNNRIYFWKTYVRMFFDNPVVGQGNYWLSHGLREEYYNRMGFSQLTEKYSAHNNILEILGSAGLLGLVVVSLGCYFLFRTLRKDVLGCGSRPSPGKASCSLGVFAPSLFFAFLANVFHAMTQNVFFDSSVVYIYLSLCMVFVWQKVFWMRRAE